MPRRISSKWTSFVLPLVIVLYTPVVLFHVVTFDPPSLQWWLLILFFIAVNVIGLIICPLPKHVDVADTSFTVTSILGRRSVALPLTAITEIKPSWFSKTVTIHLNTKSAFGLKINFMPKVRMFSHPVFGAHPDVNFLQQAVVDARVALDKATIVTDNVVR